MASEARGKNRPSKTKVRAARRSRRHRRRRLLRYGSGIVVGVIALAFIVSLFIGSIPLGNIGRSAPDGPGIRIDDQGAPHVVPGVDHASYNSIPATSGWHYAQPLAPVRWGIHDEPLIDEVLLHNMEHGYVIVHYNCPDGCDELVTQLTGIVNTSTSRGGKVILISDEKGIKAAGDGVFATLQIPYTDPFVAPILNAIPMQLLAYYTAVAKGIRISPRKVRLVIDLIRGKNVALALGILDSVNKGSAPVVKTLLKSAIANAENQNENIEVDTLVIQKAFVDAGPTLKRWRPRAMGRASPIRKRSSRITLTVG